MDETMDPKHSFRDAHKTLTEEQVHLEAGRCLSCGASIVDENKCIGCGICTTKCEFDAIHLHRDHPECSKMVPSEDKFKEIGAYMAGKAAKTAFSKTPAVTKKVAETMKKTGNAARKAAGTIGKTENAAKKAAGTARKTRNTARKAAGTARKTRNTERKAAGTARKTGNTARKAAEP